MKITFLGSGSAFVLGHENYHSNILIEDDYTSYDENDEGHYQYVNLLFDAGTTIPDALYAQRVDPTKIQNIFISHNHADHSGGMEYLGFKNYFSTFPFGENKPTVYAHCRVLHELWENSMKAGMKYLSGSEASMRTYFKTSTVDTFGSFALGKHIACEMTPTKHVDSGTQRMPSFGLKLHTINKNVFITGDCQMMDPLVYKTQDLIFHDCEVADYPNSVHAQYRELVKLPEAIKAKMWLYHYNTNDGEVQLPDARADGFLGFVRRGDKFDI